MDGEGEGTTGGEGTSTGAAAAPARPAAPAQQQQQDGGQRRTGGTETAADLRAEAAAYRVQARDAKDLADRLQRELDEEKGRSTKVIDEEKVKVTERLTKFQGKMLETELKAEALAAGLQDVDLIALINRAEVKVDDDGNVVGAKEAVEAFKKTKPAYFKPAEAAAGAAAGAAPVKGVKTGSEAAPAVNNNVGATSVKDMNKADATKSKVEFLASLRK